MSTAPLAPPARPQNEYLRQSEAWDRLMDARKQDTEVLTVAHEISALLAVMATRARQVGLHLTAAREALRAQDLERVAHLHDQMAILLACHLDHLARVGGKEAELVALEMVDVKMHEEEAHMLAIRDKELRRLIHWRPSDAH